MGIKLTYNLKKKSIKNAISLSQRNSVNVIFKYELQKQKIYHVLNLRSLTI